MIFPGLMMVQAKQLAISLSYHLRWELFIEASDNAISKKSLSFESHFQPIKTGSLVGNETWKLSFLTNSTFMGIICNFFG